MKFLNLRLPTALMIMVPFLTSSCVTSGRLGSRGYVDPTGVKTLDESSANTVGLAERSSMETLKTRIAVLEGELEEARALYQAELSTLNAQILALKDENSQLKGDLESSSKGRVSEDTKKAASLLWAAALNDLNQSNCDSALPLLKQIVDRYPEDPHAYYAHMATAMCLYAQKKFSSAAGGFAFVAQKYPSSPGIQMAWYGQGAGLYKMLKGSESLLFFKQTASRWPKTQEGLSAASILAKKSQPPNDLFLAFPNWVKGAPN